MPEPSKPTDASKSTPRPLPRAKCRNCLKVFAKKRPWMRFCNTKCRNTFHNDNRRLEHIEAEEILNDVANLLEKDKK